MTPQTFVTSLLAAVRQSAKTEADYFATPPVAKPPAQLERIAAWFLRLSVKDRQVAREALQFAAEGSLFLTLTYLDNLASLTDTDGELELCWIDPHGQRVKLNEPEGELLTDLFNALDARSTPTTSGNTAAVFLL